MEFGNELHLELFKGVLELQLRPNKQESVRREEHKLAVRVEQTASAFAQHILMTGYKIDFEETIMISKSEHLPTKIREAPEQPQQARRHATPTTGLKNRFKVNLKRL
ncbi:hypothetical protein Trydic_g3939 [Trypoxylus dichotomus]